MAKLTYAQRKKMPKKSFAVVEKKTTPSGKKKTVKRFPINDKAHARNALARLSQAHGLTSAQKSAIKAKAHKKLYGTTSPAKIKKVKASRSKK